MANVQLVRQRQTQVATAINETQSMQLVQTMLHGALSSLAFHRDLFPERAFALRYYELRQTPLPYADFAAARMPSHLADTDVLHTRLPILQRDCSKRANVFLDWLETAVFPGLESGELRAVRLLIHPGDNRDLVLETYTLTVDYTICGSGRRTPSGLAVDSSGNAASTATTTNTALQTIMRNVMDLCGHLPELPNTRLMSMELVYYHKDGKAKNVAGFVPFEESDLSFQQAKGWDGNHYTRFFNFPTGHYDTHLNITGSKHDQSLPTRRSQEMSTHTKLSSNIVSRYHDITPMPPPSNPRDVAPASLDRLSTHKARETERFQSPVTPGNDVGESGEQSSLSHGMNSDLRNMMQPEQITQGDTQTQNAFQPSVFEDAATVTPTSVRTSNMPTPLNTNSYSSIVEHLNTQRLDAIPKTKLSHINTVPGLAKKTGRRIARGQWMLCQCGFQAEEGEKVKCSACGTWQHLHCYGYTSAEDPRLPAKHICYCCLLADTDQEAWTALGMLAIKRRTMFHAARNGLRTIHDLQKTLCHDHDVAVDMYAMAKKSSFIVAARNSKKPGYRATGKALYVPAQDDDSIRELLETYFDPMTHCGHHYGHQAGTTLTESEIQTNVRLIKALASDDLPPAAVPRKKKVPKAKVASADDDGSSDDDDDDDSSGLQHTRALSGVGMWPSHAFQANSEPFQWDPTQYNPTMAGLGQAQGKRRGSEDEMTDTMADNRPTTNTQTSSGLRMSPSQSFQATSEYIKHTVEYDKMAASFRQAQRKRGIPEDQVTGTILGKRPATNTIASSGMSMRPLQAFKATSETSQYNSTMAGLGRHAQRKKRGPDDEAMDTMAGKRLATKRGSDDQVMDVRADKRLAAPTSKRQRFTSLRSKRTIHANGLLSSPYGPQ